MTRSWPPTWRAARAPAERTPLKQWTDPTSTSRSKRGGGGGRRRRRRRDGRNTRKARCAFGGVGSGGAGGRRAPSTPGRCRAGTAAPSPGRREMLLRPGRSLRTTRRRGRRSTCRGRRRCSRRGRCWTGGSNAECIYVIACGTYVSVHQLRTCMARWCQYRATKLLRSFSLYLFSVICIYMQCVLSSDTIRRLTLTKA